METQDLLSAALDECGLDLDTFSVQANSDSFAVSNGDSKAEAKQITIRSGESILHFNKNVNSNSILQMPKIFLPYATGIRKNNTLTHTFVEAAKPPQSVPNVSPMFNASFQDFQNATSSAVVDSEVDVEEEEEIFQADTYADYMPSKLKIGTRHPDPVVETSSLSSVLPPDVWYSLSIPEEAIDEGKLSALQLEAIVYASQQHENFLPDGTRAGFLIGDGAGVGKGRTVAGIIYENYLMGRKKALWLSVSNDLKYDAERDLRDIGAKKINVYSLNKFKYGKISSKENGGVKKGVIFATYSSLISESHSTTHKYKTRFKQLMHWCGEDFDGVIVFDECHKAKNLCPSSGSSKATKTGLTVLELQRKLPKARIVYASATGASEPKNMAYMTRLGLWGPGTSFPEFSDFISTVEKRGVGAMELVAIDMKLRGMYIARQLSFAGVQFRIEEIPLSKKFIKLYNECVALWVDAKNKFEKALELMEDETTIKKAVWAQFWASHQRFFKYLCIAAKVKFAVNLSREALKDEKSVVIGLQSTGEAKTLEQLEDSGGELTDFVSTAKAVFQSLIEKHFPAPNRKKTLRLLGLDTSFFDDLGIKLEMNGNEVRAVDQPVNSASTSKLTNGRTRKQIASSSKGKSSNSDSRAPWSDDSDSDEDASGKESDFKPSDSDDDDSECSSGVSEHESEGTNDDEDSDVEPWDLYQQGKLDTENKKRKRQKSKPKDRKKKKLKKDFSNIKAESMSEQAGVICEKMRDQLLDHLEEISDKLPPNTLDELIDELGGSDNVAEMTGRKGRVISNENGTIQYESRSANDVPLEILNLTEKQRFMDGEKQIAIISEAASSGISLHSDRRAKNRKRRVHLTIELPWSADRAIQQFGRTHRSNQVNAPEYVFLISDLAGEQRFASTVAKRLESLGALTHGDRRATESRDLSKFNIDNKYGRETLEIVMKSIVAIDPPVVSPPSDYKGNFFEDCRKGLVGVGLVLVENNIPSLDKDYQVMSKFLNRVLGLEVHLQNALFKYFSDTLDYVIKRAKRLGRYDLGIMDLTSDIGKVERISYKSFIRKHSTGAAKIEIHGVAVERGMSWDEAKSLWSQCKTPEEGFYLTESEHMVRKGVMLAVSDTSSRSLTKHIFRIYKPNTGLQTKTETLTSLRERGKKILPDEAESLWQDIHNTAENTCGHVLWYGNCRRLNAKLNCDVGLRKRIYHILSGSVLSVWSTIEKAVPHVQSKLQIVRLKTKDGLRVIGKEEVSAHLFIVFCRHTYSTNGHGSFGESFESKPGNII